MASRLLEDIVLAAFNTKKEEIENEKKQLERTYLSKPAEELVILNNQLQELIEKHGIHSIQAQQYLYANIKSFTDIQRRIKAQSIKGAVGKALERIAAIDNDLISLEDETSIRKQLNQKSFGMAS